VFIVVPPAPEKKKPVINEDGEEEPVEEIDEEELANMLKPKFQKHIYPDSVIHIRGEEDFIRQRAGKLSVDANLKWDRDNLERRLAEYRENNALDLYEIANSAEDLGHPKATAKKLPLTRFFQENKTELLEIDCDGDQFEMFQSMRVYTERHGRPYNYLPSVEDLNGEREEYLVKEEMDMKAERFDKEHKETDVAREMFEALVKLQDGRIESVYAHCAEIAQTDNLNMRQFLMKCIIPVLTEGMIDVWKVKPTDPIDYLSEYVFRKSNEMRTRQLK